MQYTLPTVIPPDLATIEQALAMYDPSALVDYDARHGSLRISTVATEPELLASLRGAGIAKPTMIVQAVSVLINAVLAPVLVAGWLTGKPMGVAGAGLASTLAASFGVVMLYLLFKREHLALRFGPEARPPKGRPRSNVLIF